MRRRKRKRRRRTSVLGMLRRFLIRWAYTSIALCVLSGICCGLGAPRYIGDPSSVFSLGFFLAGAFELGLPLSVLAAPAVLLVTWIGWLAGNGARDRRDSSRCAKCGYLLYGLKERRCPECGTPF